MLFAGLLIEVLLGMDNSEYTVKLMLLRAGLLLDGVGRDGQF